MYRTRSRSGGTPAAVPADMARSRPVSPGATDPRVGYYFAVLNTIISGIAVFVNSNGVKIFADSTLYTALKNAVVGIALLVPLILVASTRVEFRRLTRREWGLLLLLAVVGGSAAYALDFRGLQISTPVTAAVIGHSQFLFVALFAAVLLRERFGPAIWLALVVLFISLCIGLKLNVVRWDAGAIYLISSTLLFALAAILMKHILRSVSILTVMIFKMSLGALLLLAYVGASGHLGAVRHLSTQQWSYVLVTGLILLAFTVTSVVGLRHASATAVTAIPAAAPIITTALVVVSKHVTIAPATLFGLALTLAAVMIIYTLGRRQELRAAEAGRVRPQRQRAVPT